MIAPDIRKQLARFVLCRDCMHNVAALCDHMIAQNITNSHELFHAMTTSLFVLYARPFGKNRVIGRMTDLIVSKEQKRFHKVILSWRDQIFAHTDADALSDQSLIPLNRVCLESNGNGYRWVTRNVHPQGSRLDQLRDHCLNLKRKCEYHLDKLDARYQRFYPKEKGYHTLLVDGGTADFIKS